jgi:hypothetical protein
VSGTYLFHTLFHKKRVHSLAFRYELTICHHSSAETLVFVCIISVKDNIVDFLFLQKSKILGSILPVFGKNQSSLGVLGDVLTCLCVVGRVNANGDTASKKAAVEGETPLRCIETDDVYGSELFKFKGDQRLGELKALIIVLPEVYGFLC